MSKKGPKTSKKLHIIGMITVVTKNYKLKMTPKAEKTESIHHAARLSRFIHLINHYL